LSGLSRRQLVGSSSSSSKAQTSCCPRARLSSFSYCAARMPTSLATICTTFGFAVAVLTARSLLPSPLQQLLPAEEPGSSPAVKSQVPAPATLGHFDLPATIGATLHNQFIEDALILGQSQNNEIKGRSRFNAVEQARSSWRERSTVEKLVLRRRWVLLRALLKSFALGEIRREDHVLSCSFASRRQLDDRRRLFHPLRISSPGVENKA
jgi:hypothetical protein